MDFQVSLQKKLNSVKQDPVYITFIFSRTVLIKKNFHQTMVFFNEVLFTSYCCIRYFHKRNKWYFIIFLGFLFCHFSMQKVSTRSNYAERYPANHFSTPRGYSKPPANYILHKFPTSLLIRTPPPPFIQDLSGAVV